MKRIVQLTKDGSHTIAIPERQITYHSIFGAIQESKHVFIEAGLAYQLAQNSNRPLRLLECGFGTGLNALLSWQYANNHAVALVYDAVEPFPLLADEYGVLNYEQELGTSTILSRMHQTAHGESVALDDYFTLTRFFIPLHQLQPPAPYDLIYFDAFAPDAQPELWTIEQFSQLYEWLNPGGILVTYCSKSIIRKNMQAAGFSITKIPGPPGKREMVRAIKQP